MCAVALLTQGKEEMIEMDEVIVYKLNSVVTYFRKYGLCSQLPNLTKAI